MSRPRQAQFHLSGWGRGRLTRGRSGLGIGTSVLSCEFRGPFLSGGSGSEAANSGASWGQGETERGKAGWALARLAHSSAGPGAPVHTWAQHAGTLPGQFVGDLLLQTWWGEGDPARSPASVTKCGEDPPVEGLPLHRRGGGYVLGSGCGVRDPDHILQVPGKGSGCRAPAIRAN